MAATVFVAAGVAVREARAAMLVGVTGGATSGVRQAETAVSKTAVTAHHNQFTRLVVWFCLPNRD